MVTTPLPDAGARTLANRYVIGLDLGQAADFTALAVGQIVVPVTTVMTPETDAIVSADGTIRLPEVAVTKPVERRAPFHVHIRLLQRFPLHTPYPRIVDRVADLTERLRGQGAPVLVVDHTGVGRAVVDLFKAAQLKVPMWPVTIATSAMGQAKRDPHSLDWTVPKKDLVGVLQTLAHSDRLKVSQSLPEARILADELTSFRMKYTAAANVTYEAWREGDHDDLVLAVAMACWAAQRWATPGGVL